MASLIVGFATLIGPSADAVQAGRQCDQGVRVGADCLIEADAAMPSQACPVSATIFEDADECFELVAPTNACPEGTTVAGSSCRQAVELVTYDTECPPSFTNLDGTCIRFDPSEITLECAEGTLGDSMCEVLGADPIPTTMICVVSGDVVLDGDDCYRPVSQREDCPTESAEDAGGLCRQSVELVPGPPVCEDGFRYVEGSCIRFSSPTPEGECEEGVLQGGVLCVAEGGFVPGPPICPVSDEVVLDGDECFMFVSRDALGCPVGTTLDPNGFDCREPVDLTPADFVCADGFEIQNDEFCLGMFDPLVIEICAQGTLLPGGGTCIVQGGNPTPGTPFCPVSATVFEDVDGCYRLIAPDLCPPGTSAAPDAESCRRPVELEAGPLTCPDEQRVVESTCFEVEAAVYRCEGLDVTINMLLGEPGIGTDGDDVILGSRGDDVIDGLGGNDVVCALGGNDVISGGTGQDLLYGQAGDDRIDGGAGDDTIYGGGNDDMIYGGADADLLYGQSGIDTIDGGAGNDTVYGGSDDDMIYGGADADLLYGQSGIDTIDGGAGDDTVYGGSDDDMIYGGADADLLYGQSGIDTIDGEAGDDTIYGGGDDDTVSGGEGNDDLRGGAGNDDLSGDAGQDELRGGPDDDLVQGGDDNDRLIGSAGEDVCVGGTGDDSYARSCETQQD